MIELAIIELYEQQDYLKTHWCWYRGDLFNGISKYNDVYRLYQSWNFTTARAGKYDIVQLEPIPAAATIRARCHSLIAALPDEYIEDAFRLLSDGEHKLMQKLLADEWRQS